MKDLSIIILSYNTRELTLNCLESVVKNSKDLDCEVIVVDNASEDGSVNAISNFFLKLVEKESKYRPKKSPNLVEASTNSEKTLLKLIVNKRNLGFSKANNQGIRIARGRYILILNSDTIIKKPFLKEMLEWMDANPKMGITSCALRNPDGSLQGTGGYFPYLFRVFAWMFFLDDLPLVSDIIKPFHPLKARSPIFRGENFYKKLKEVDWLTGAFMMIKKAVFDDIGYFDEDYFMYTEDVDFCYRAKQKGWKIYYNPKWFIIHLGGASSTSEYPIISEYKGLKTFYKKYFPGWRYNLLRIFLKIGAFLRILVFGPFKGVQSARAYVKAFAIA